MKILLLSICSTIFSVLMTIALLSNHIDDGNVWGIYFQDGHLLIGDFWGACFVLLFTLGAIASFGVTIWRMIALKYGLIK